MAVCCILQYVNIPNFNHGYSASAAAISAHISWVCSTRLIMLIPHFGWIINLVGCAITILKNMNVNGKDDILYMKWKIKAMFQTTNQSVKSYNLHDFKKKTSIPCSKPPL